MGKFITSSADRMRRFLIATHSPELLDASRADVVEVRRREGQFHLAPLAGVDFETMAELGLTPSDLLRQQRGFLLVEGQHDMDVLEILLGDELRRLRVEVLALRGATELSAPKSRFLFRFSRAHVFVMLDNLDNDQVSTTGGSRSSRRPTRRAWMRLEKSWRAPSRLQCLVGAIEIKALSEFLSASLDHENWNRVTPFGLTKGDVIEYLPVGPFGAGEVTWEELRSAFESEKATGSTKLMNFKKWWPSRKVHVTDEKVRRAAALMDQIPRDFTRLLKTIEANVDLA